MEKLHPEIEKLMDLGWKKDVVNEYYITLKLDDKRVKIVKETGKTIREWTGNDERSEEKELKRLKKKRKKQQEWRKKQKAKQKNKNKKPR